MRAKFSIAPVLAGVLALGVSAGDAEAKHYSHGAGFVLSCENGANYTLHPGPITLSGDVVTGHLHLSPRRAVHVRLIPMGVGYRYAGRGVWIDGVRERALIYLSKNNPIACTVAAA